MRDETCNNRRRFSSINSTISPLLVLRIALITTLSVIIAVINHCIVVIGQHLTHSVLLNSHHLRRHRQYSESSSSFFLVNALLLQQHHCCNSRPRFRRYHSPTLAMTAQPQQEQQQLEEESSSTNVPTSKNQLVGCINIALSVDGFIADKNGNVDWLNEQQQHLELPVGEGQQVQQQQVQPLEEEYGFNDFLKSIDVMIMGRNTFDVVVGFGKDLWAYGDDLPIVVYTRNVQSVVIPEWVPKSVKVKSASSPEALWKELEDEVLDRHNKNNNTDDDEDGPAVRRVYIDGGRTIQAFLHSGLIHHMTLSRIPILLGEGIPLFDGMDPTRRRLQHVSTKAYPNGIVTTMYNVSNST